jgi:alkylation response protein AidB-like acyl-CoA dehydrogenase
LTINNVKGAKVDFNFSELEKMLQNRAREFAQKLVLPQAMEIDRQGKFPFQIAREMGQLGFRGIPYPNEYGGISANYISYALALEQISQASMTVAAIMAINTVPEEALFCFGDETQKEHFLAPLAKGESLGGIAFTEAETGSDPQAIATEARWHNQNYIITGEKQFVALSPAANLVLLFAQTKGKLSAFIVDTSSPGYLVQETCETIGLKGLGASMVYLDEVNVPKEALLGEEGEGFTILLEAIGLARLGVAIEGVGVAQAALELSLEYAQRRQACGKPIAIMPTIQAMLAEMASRIEAGRWLAYHTASLRDQGKKIPKESAMAKLFCSQMAVAVTRMAMQVHGSYGTMKTMPVERLYRDAKMTEIYVGVSEIQRAIIAGHLLSRQDEP